MAVSTLNTSQRRVLYGLNVVVAGALSLFVLCFLVWGANRLDWRTDISSRRISSLSPRTEKLLANLNQTLTITGIYTVVSEYDEVAQRRQAAVRDLLDLYETAGRGRVTAQVIDPLKDQGRLEQLEARLKSKPVFAEHIRENREALEEFKKVNVQIQQLATNETEILKRFIQSDPKLNAVRNLLIVVNILQKLDGDCRSLAKEVDELLVRKQPQYGNAIPPLREELAAARGSIQEVGQWMTSEGLQIEGLADELKTFFEEANTRRQPVVDAITALLERMENLKPGQLDEAYNELSRYPTSPPILVETENDARVVSFEDTWPFKSEPGRTGDGPDPQRDFAGEAAVSSAILQLTEKARTGVVFVRFGGEPLLRPDFSNVNLMMQQLPTAPYIRLNETLQKNNFVTAEWNLEVEKQTPTVPDAARTVYVVFPPSPPVQTNPMQPPPSPGISEDDKRILFDAIRQSGMAIFMGGWAAPAGPLAGPGGAYAYNEYLGMEWGIEVRATHLAVHFLPNPQKPGYWVPATREVLPIGSDMIRFTDHPIAAPLASSPVGLRAVAPLSIASKLPEGVKVRELAYIPETDDLWATPDPIAMVTELRRDMGVRPKATDVKPPFPVAVAASKPDQRVVVFGSETFAADEVALQLMIDFASGRLYQANPANTDLFINSLHWLTQDAGRIAIGPRTSDVPRLDKLRPGPALTFWRVFLVAIWPACALLVGAGVWLMRRR